MITVTDNAVKHLRILIAEQSDLAPGAGLRIAIGKGGCSGMQYEMSFDTARSEDEVSERDGVQIIVDPVSAGMLGDSLVDYCGDLTGTGFRIQNPLARRTCGCGTSFEPDVVTAPADHAAAH